MSVSGRALVAIHLPPQRAAKAIAEAWSADGAVMPLDPDIPGDAALAIARTQGATELIGPEGSEVLGGPGADAELGAVVFTSGTTGAPKPVELTQAALSAAARLTNEALGARHGDRWLCCLPLHHIAGLGILRRAAELGAPPVVLDGFDAAELGAAEADLVSLVPTTLLRLLDAGVDVAKFKAILLGGAAIPHRLIERAAAGGARVVRSYGMTETCGGVVYDGVPLPGVRVRAGDGILPGGPDGEGQITISSPTLMRGYRGGEPLGGDWFTTSDAGRISGGRLEVTGRMDDVIVTGGEKVAPAKVEAALGSLPGVSDALVVGRQDAHWGQAVVAFVVAEQRDGTALREGLAPLLLRHEIPKSFVFVDAIPRTPAGKPDAAWVQEQAPGSGRPGA